MGSQRVGHDWATEQWQNASWVTFNIFFILYYLVKTTKLSGGGGLVAKSCPTLATPWTVVYQAPLSMEFSRQEYWSRLLFPSPGDLPNPGIKPGSPALQEDSLPTELWGKPFSRGSSQPRDWTQVSHTASRFLTTWATREARLLCTKLLTYNKHAMDGKLAKSLSSKTTRCVTGDQGFQGNWST